VMSEASLSGISSLKRKRGRFARPAIGSFDCANSEVATPAGFASRTRRPRLLSQPIMLSFVAVSNVLLVSGY
jgi:hypothetical protein